MKTAGMGMVSGVDIPISDVIRDAIRQRLIPPGTPSSNPR